MPHTSEHQHWADQRPECPHTHGREHSSALGNVFGDQSPLVSTVRSLLRLCGSKHRVSPGLAASSSPQCSGNPGAHGGGYTRQAAHVPIIFYWALVLSYSMKFLTEGSWARKVEVRNAGCALHVGLSVVLASPLVFELLVRKAVAEKHVGCQHHVHPGDAPLLHVDVLVVIPVVTCGQRRRSLPALLGGFRVRSGVQLKLGAQLLLCFSSHSPCVHWVVTVKSTDAP